MSNLEKKNIIVTGASGGIGNAIIKKLSEVGANILASGTRIEKLEELKKNFEGLKILKFDISKSDKIEEFIENATNELGGSLDGIVNNAGITQDNLAIRMSLDEWQKVININLTSTFLMSKFAIKKCLKINLEKLLILLQLLVTQEI
jgi:3-oxoacyl-[acyl-carrier protein] reductase